MSGAEDRGVDLRLAAPVACAWLALGVLLGVEDALWPAVWACGATAVVSLGLSHSAGRRPRMRAALRWFALSTAAASLLLVAAAVAQPERRPDLLLDAAERSQHLVLEGSLTQAVVDPGAQHRARAVLRAVEVAGERHEVSVPVTVFGDFARAGEVGDRVVFSGTAAATGPADSTAFLVFARGEVEVTPDRSGPVAAAGELRAGFRMLVSELPAPGAGLLPGLAIGDTSAVDAELGEQMKAASLTHLTAVSGANCAIVVGLVFALAAALRLPRWARVGASILALVIFVLIVTPEPSVLRASVMAVAVLLAMVMGRGAAGVPVLALAVLVLLGIDPWLARSYGFILSVLATAGLLVLAGPLAQRLSHFVPMPIAVLVAVPLAAQLACQPVIILLTPSIPTYGVVANLLAGPAAPAASVLGLLACLLQPIAPWLALPVAWLAWLPSAWIAAVAAFFSALPGNQLPWAEGALGLLLAAVLTVLGLGAALARRRRWWAASLCVVLVIVGGTVAGQRLGTLLQVPAVWQFAACDVGQGDATLLRDGDSIMLVDTGEHVELLEGCLSLLGIADIDLLVLTHFDRDHVGAVEAVVGRVGTVLVGPSGSEDDERMLRRLSDAGAEVVVAERGTEGVLGRLAWTVLWPASGRKTPPGNDASITLLVDGKACGCPSSLLLGDLGREAQVRMLAGAERELAAVAPVGIVKVSHHGSADQHERVYEAAAATLGVIGVGADNTYGHPAPSILDVLERAGTAVARTDRHGLVLVSADPDGTLSLWTERSAED